MSVLELEGREYRGRLPGGASAVAAFVAATGDDPQRWTSCAPPGYAAAALFSVAPSFLWSSEVGAFANVLIHVDQAFTWHGPWPAGAPTNVAGRVERVRMRSGAAWVGFTAEAVCDGVAVLESHSTFMMSDGRPDGAPAERLEPGPWDRADNDVPQTADLSDQAGPTPLRKSASRADLVRYAGATGDFNPLHWDHAVARAAGLPSIVCHGLLSASWALQQAARYGAGQSPVREARFRFRHPVFPGDQAVVEGAVASHGSDSPELTLTVSAGGETCVTGSATLAS